MIVPFKQLPENSPILTALHTGFRINLIIIKELSKFAETQKVFPLQQQQHNSRPAFPLLYLSVQRGTNHLGPTTQTAS